MSSHILSKSSFLKGLQCHKALFLYKNYYHLKDAIPKERQAIFKRGHEVGFLARKLFPGGIDASPVKISRFDESVEKTKQLVAAGTNVIYEAAFQNDDVLVALDILETSPNKPDRYRVTESVTRYLSGLRTPPAPLHPDSYRERGRETTLKWNLYEVKSSAKISSTYILDAALQYRVIKKSGLYIADFFILNLNTKYERNGNLELEKLFSKTSVLKEIIKLQPFIEKNIFALKEMLAENKIPEISIGAHCFEPYDCDFKNHCWRNVPENSVFEIPFLPLREKFKLYDTGIKNRENFYTKNSLNPFQKIHFESEKNNTPFIDSIEIKKILSQLKYPLLFVDFEVMMPAIPMFEGTHAFQNIPFQYSIHVKENAETEKAEHRAWLAETGTDPRKFFIEYFLHYSENAGSIIVFDAVLEKSVLNSLKKDFPEYSEKINERLNKIIDLMIPFKKKFFYSHKMSGNFSLKDISNALFPESNFAKLKINNGRLAMIAYENLQTETDMFKIPEIKEALLEYGKTDTETMVKIIELFYFMTKI